MNITHIQEDEPDIIEFRVDGTKHEIISNGKGRYVLREHSSDFSGFGMEQIYDGPIPCSRLEGESTESYLLRLMETIAKLNFIK